ncbi:MAG TPA: TetR/AcrR family transcriptional regulator [Candidatus Limnocylindria bacterium]|nr:TetR/AcrR family transcriptional regulator [Candidatus Limnocylindria bacterium]
MAKAGAGRKGRRGRVDRDRVLNAALQLADSSGVDSLTMARIGRRLGVEAMSLYRHVRNKEDVLDGIVDRVFAEIEPPSASAGWKQAMRDRALSVRAVLARHPWAIGLLESRLTPGPANLGHRDAVLAVLFDAGFSSATATHIYNTLDSYIYGFALQEASLPFSTADELAEVGELLLAQVPAEQYPHLARVGRELLAAGFDYAAEFEWGLDLLLDALERRFQPT